MFNDTSTQKINMPKPDVNPSGKSLRYKMCSITGADVYADTHEGFVRPANEDSFAYYVRPDGHLTFALVADGIGGQANGKLASILCSKMLIASCRELASMREQPQNSDLEAFFDSEIRRINDYIYAYAEEHDFPAPMGTTLVAAALTDKSIVSAHAGDSRMYRLRQDKLEQLTRDHSIVQEMLDRGVITPKEAKNHPQAHVISRSVGSTSSTTPEVHSFERDLGDRFLLCSDGLTLHVTDEEMQKALSTSYDPEQCVRILMSTALRRGALDNVTVVCIFA